MHNFILKADFKIFFRRFVFFSFSFLGSFCVFSVKTYVLEEGAEVEDKVEDVEGSPGQEEYNRDQDQHHVRLPSSLHLTSSSEYSWSYSEPSE